ncbi:isopentenyl phosphate kinase [Salinirubellus salinus]|uniref:Isopentenyl phosphate kinase n=1 Tax=Salinirubellus salinus TaxID=1364945 RepID=A0A9E7R5B9_9EURY|nr:isopentenyl phosphate kinase [Salinirubellus salinus]UWM55852.1 isopentenyl phosphate kinase [Salinirubellus salinus]
MTTVLKLGGSVVTRKDEPETVDETNLERAAAALADGPGDLVVVHGGGSFGHHHASEHGVSTTEGTHEAVGVTDIHGAMKRLNDAVVAALQRAGVPAVPVHPFSLAWRDADGTLHLPADSVRAMLDEGFVPVLHGDVVVHAGRGATILSGDELVVSLAGSLDADRVGLCSDVPGVLDDEGTVVPRIERFEDVADYLGGSEATDVTGGMAAKVRELLALDAPAQVFDLDGLAGFLDGADTGTVID